MIRTLRQVDAFARNALLEGLRNKVLYAVLVAALAALGAASAFGALSLHQEERLFNNLVFAIGHLFLVALAIYQGVNALHREIESKTIFTVLSKPVTRASFLVGKFAASVGILAVCWALMFGAKALTGLALGYEIGALHLATYLGSLMQLVLVLALAFFFSAFSGPLLSALFTFGLVVVGSLTPQLADASRQFANEGNPLHLILDVALYVVPDLEKLNLSYELATGIEVGWGYLLHALLYTGVTAGLLLGFGYLIFSRRDFA
ncbi:hypothetical protein DV096_06770 [Bradymonadaceae bacterium TMQ3]|uniref:ABC transporter permease n=1 Tax=Lujinxingia sediminis TaxID=2480984 RepID=A0ABY0CTK7_9DELT|nr:ABC transporter permease [Lujinxingia sediminis]RDV38516.1 hypothetical protein DV096_06770 [Bradymonadaceae bacterium TMQ3]RVU44937.1 hypothetical protein EA187_10420 [Lujinxingia sediminis]TXC76716.1 ABC transporter permease subunit [Bradymonadales bacterium TMQ1]